MKIITCNDSFGIVLNPFPPVTIVRSLWQYRMASSAMEDHPCCPPVDHHLVCWDEDAIFKPGSVTICGINFYYLWKNEVFDIYVRILY